MNKTAVILVNVGSPENPETKSVRKYLFQFLNDKRIIDLPWLIRKILVNLIIVPFRAPKSAKLYKLLWNEKGFPLKYYMESLSSKLQILLGDKYRVISANCYGNPSLKDILQKIEFEKFHEIILFPLFPQYSSSTTGSVFELSMSEIKNWNVIPKLKFINQFYNNPKFISAFSKSILNYNLTDFEHIIFSFHGLPNSHINKIHKEISIENCSCEKDMPSHGEYCYKAACYQSARLLATALDLSVDKYSITFQSRLTNNWLTPFTDKTLIERAKGGVKKILIIAPSFVTDCLETTVELSIEYKNLFLSNGGEKLVAVECLNDSDEWVKSLKDLVID